MLKASPLINQWVTRGKMCGLEGFRLFKMFFTARIAFSLNLVPSYTTVSKNIVSVNFGGEFNNRAM